MVYKRNDDGTFTVKGTRNDWIVSKDLSSCDCPKFKFLLQGRSPCHHITEVTEGEKESEPMRDTGRIGDFKEWCPAEYVSLLSEQQFSVVYGDVQLEHLLKTFEVIIIKNMVRIL